MQLVQLLQYISNHDDGSHIVPADITNTPVMISIESEYVDDSTDVLVKILTIAMGSISDKGKLHPSALVGSVSYLTLTGGGKM